MKSFRLPLCIACLSLLLCCSACALFGESEYHCNIDGVKSISIIRLDKYIKEEYRYDYTVLAEVSDIEVFIDRLNSMKHSINRGEPYVLYEQYTVIRIDYNNGDYDLIHQYAQSFESDGKVRTGYFLFNEEEFNALLSDYIIVNDNMVA